MAAVALPPSVMRQATVRSRCECQSHLVAILDENKQVVAAYVVDKHGHHESGPAHAIGARHARFDIGWLCNVCGRNTLRSFATDALAFVDAPPPPAPIPA